MGRPERVQVLAQVAVQVEEWVAAKVVVLVVAVAVVESSSQIGQAEGAQEGVRAAASRNQKTCLIALMAAGGCQQPSQLCFLSFCQTQSLGTVLLVPLHAFPFWPPLLCADLPLAPAVAALHVSAPLPPLGAWWMELPCAATALCLWQILSLRLFPFSCSLHPLSAMAVFQQPRLHLSLMLRVVVIWRHDVLPWLQLWHWVCFGHFAPFDSFHLFAPSAVAGPWFEVDSLTLAELWAATLLKLPWLSGLGPPFPSGAANAAASAVAAVVAAVVTAAAVVAAAAAAL